MFNYLFNKKKMKAVRLSVCMLCAGMLAASCNENFLTLHIQADNGVAMQVDLLPEGKIQDTWKKVDLSGLGAVKSIRFSMTRSDSTAYGLNTPAYVAVDNIEIVL